MHELRFVLTPFCNYRCFFCHKENANSTALFCLNPSDYEFLAQTAYDCFGWNTATITGGEPLISPIFTDVCKRLKKIGVETTVVTNASLLTNPSEMLKNVSQLNVSLHTMQSNVYEWIVKVQYPLEEVLKTIRETRKQLPKLIIHINCTVIKGINDSVEDIESLLKFAKEVNASAKFIDLSTDDESLSTDAETIVLQLRLIGFSIKSKDAWQYHLVRNDEEVIVTKCPFNGKHSEEPVRDIFVASNVIHDS